MNTLCRVREFAERAGVTVKSLYHYDRLGLLKAQRTAAGYRVYSDRDLERLQQIVCLRFLGMPLRQIGAVLNQAMDLPAALRLQREALEEQARMTARAINAIVEAEKEVRPGEPLDPTALGRLIGAIEMQRVDLSRHFIPEAFAKLKEFHDRARSGTWIEEWTDIRRDVLAAIDEDPSGETGRSLALRFRELTKRNGEAFSLVGSPDVLEGLRNVGNDQSILTPALVRKFRESSVAKVVPFILKAMAALPPEA